MICSYLYYVSTQSLTRTLQSIEASIEEREDFTTKTFVDRSLFPSHRETLEK
jgi:hypothetical protein